MPIPGQLRTLIVITAALILAPCASAESARRRAVRTPAPQCSWSLVRSYSAPVPATGMLRGILTVSGSPASCTSWRGYSDADWARIEEVPGQALVTVDPNLSSQPRIARLTIAGVAHELVQEGASVTVTPPGTANLLTNTTFDLNLNGWSWPSHLPNGSGVATWTAVDANSSIASGSIRLRNTQTGHSFQHMQCVKIIGETRYDFGAAVRVERPGAGGGVLAAFEYTNDSCSDLYYLFTVKEIRPPTAGTWERATESFVSGRRAKSVLFLLASGAESESPFDVWFDDVYLRQR